MSEIKRPYEYDPDTIVAEANEADSDWERRPTPVTGLDAASVGASSEIVAMNDVSLGETTQYEAVPESAVLKKADTKPKIPGKAILKRFTKDK